MILLAFESAANSLRDGCGGGAFIARRQDQEGQLRVDKLANTFDRNLALPGPRCQQRRKKEPRCWAVVLMILKLEAGRSLQAWAR
jgi:hypothetical protein